MKSGKQGKKRRHEDGKNVRQASEKCPPNVRLRCGKKCDMISSVKEDKGSRFRKEAAFGIIRIRRRRRRVALSGSFSPLSQPKADSSPGGGSQGGRRRTRSAGCVRGLGLRMKTGVSLTNKIKWAWAVSEGERLFSCPKERRDGDENDGEHEERGRSALL